MKIEGKAGTNTQIYLNLKNPSPQNYELRIEPDSDNIKVKTKTKSVLNRTEYEYPVIIKINRGINMSDVRISNSNGFTVNSKIETIGYDLTEKDFKSKYERTRIIEIGEVEKVFFEINGGEKLLIIRNDSEQKKIPVSNLVNGITRSHFKKGINNLELINLGTGETKVCKIKIK